MKEFRIFLVVFSAVFFALLIYNALSNYYQNKAIEQALSDFTQNIKSLSSPPVSTQATIHRPKPSPKPVSKPVVIDKKLSEAQQICDFWKQAYNNENNDKHYQRVRETCPEYQKTPQALQ
ncbi:MAG: hypothetical protein PHE38_12695 [Alishewanella agri]|nr:hypothetical protein [Alishewanella agri]